MIFYETAVTSAWSALGWSMVLFLWQGAIIGLLAAAVLFGLRHRTASARYIVACGALAACLVAFMATFLVLAPYGGIPTSAGVPFLLPGSSAFATASDGNVAEIVAWCWAIGALLMAVRFARHGRWARRLKTRSVSEPDAR